MSTTSFFAPSIFHTVFILAAGLRAPSDAWLQLPIGCRA